MLVYYYRIFLFELKKSKKANKILLVTKNNKNIN